MARNRKRDFGLQISNTFWCIGGRGGRSRLPAAESEFLFSNVSILLSSALAKTMKTHQHILKHDIQCHVIMWLVNDAIVCVSSCFMTFLFCSFFRPKFSGWLDELISKVQNAASECLVKADLRGFNFGITGCSRMNSGLNMTKNPQTEEHCSRCAVAGGQTCFVSSVSAKYLYCSSFWTCLATTWKKLIPRIAQSRQSTGLGVLCFHVSFFFEHQNMCATSNTNISSHKRHKILQIHGFHVAFT